MDSYKAIGTIDGAKAMTIILFDKKNKSIHLHIYCEILGKKKIPISVKQMNTDYPEDDVESVVQHIITEEMVGKPLTFESIKKMSEAVIDENLHPMRIIRRYRN